jgi:predicted NBD/HSP70 family sugar kinase
VCCATVKENAVRIGTSTDDVRRRNLSSVLMLVHRHRALSRAELTRRTGLSRSTVKDLVEELVAGGLVKESQAATPTQAGRPSPIVRPQTRTLSVAVNPEIDAITIGLVALGGVVLNMTRLPTDGIPTAQKTVTIAAQAVDRMRHELDPTSTITAIGVAVPGLVNAAGAAVRMAPHLRWQDEELGQMLGTATGLPVVAANDANAGAIAEHIFGRHRNPYHMIYVNGGASGIGAGFVVAGGLLEGAAGYAGELGHTYVGGSGSCHCGRIGCLETEVSQSTVKTVEHQAHYLGIALGNAINLMNPTLIVLGGFLRVFPERAADVLDQAVARHCMSAPRELVRIVPASLGSETLMIGAAELAFAPLLADPAAHYHQRIDRDGAAG